MLQHSLFILGYSLVGEGLDPPEALSVGTMCVQNRYAEGESRLSPTKLITVFASVHHHEKPIGFVLTDRRKVR